MTRLKHMTNESTQAIISTLTGRKGMTMFKPRRIWSGFIIAGTFLIVGVTIRLLDISSYGLIIARISDSGYHLYFIWEWINVVAAKGQFQSGKEAGLMVKTYLMARIVLTIAASVFLLSSSNDFNLMATATIRGAHSVLYTISLVPAELHRSPEVEVELESHGNKSTSQWHPDKDQGTPDYAFRVPSQETLDTV
ncbi:hypothetical protein FPOAC2_13964 [Fusarium poae]